MKSFSLLRTNVGLTTNVKVICDSKYNLYLESIDSAPELSTTRLKKLQFNKNNFYDELVPYFFKDFPSDIAYQISYSNDSDNMSQDFANQYDDLYQMGARNIVDNKNYIEEYEYFAPLYVFKDSVPKYFIVFRIDGPGLIELNPSNFREEFLKNFKTVKLFDLTKSSALGEWVDRNFKNNLSFPNSSLEIDFRNLEFSKWIGIDYDSGGFTYKSRFLENSLEQENTLFDFEKFFFDGYKTNRVIYPQIINFSFLFDDTPATSTSLRKWSLNRYSGFYLDDLELFDCITPFIMPTLKPGIEILDENILYHVEGDPFLIGFQDDLDMWVEYNGDFYKVEKFIETSTKVLSDKISKNPTKRVINEKINKTEVSKSLKQETVKKEEYMTVNTTKYRIISELDLQGKETDLNQKTCYVNADSQIIRLDGATYSIPSFENADINLIEIDGLYHNLLYEDGYLKINSDYGFNFRDSYRFEYYINSPDPNYYKFVDLVVTKDNKPKCFKIYRAKFTDIKDFDTQVVDNEFSKYEYEKEDTLTETEETKMYTTDLRINSNPPNFNDYNYNNEVVLMPASSDYTANLETFRIVDDSLSELWRKNSIYCRFGFQNSISAHDYPYLLNNNDVHENFNRTTDTFQVIPDRRSRNLDYFYTINSGTISYLHHSLHIEKNYASQDTSFRFELDKYLNVYTYSLGTYSFDYFNYLFGSTQSFLNNEIVKNVKKYSYFDYGDKSNPNTTLFRGLKFKIFEVDSIIKEGVSIENINLFSSNKFDNYKFSILLSQNLQGVNSDGNLYDTVDWGYFLDNQYEGGNLSFKTSDTATPSNIKIGDKVEIKQFYPPISGYNGLATVTSVGSLSSGGYGFVTDKTFGLSASISGYYKVNFQWKTIKNWEHDVEYNLNDYVLYDYVLYKVNTNHTITDPNIDPTNSSYYDITIFKTPFWNPDPNIITYAKNDWCYRDGEYYIRNDVADDKGINFWHTSKPYPVSGSIVSWKGRYYKSQKAELVKVKPNQNKRNNDISGDLQKYWMEVPNPRDWYAYDENFSDDFTDDLWDKAPVWDNNEYYYSDDYVFYLDTLYRCVITDRNLESPELGEEPNKSSNWKRIYSFEPDTDFVYSPTSNPIILIGDVYYLCTFNRDLTLDSGITIYINKKWKNILINISINDNTTENIDNSERDNLYIDTNSRITASNFIRQINDLDSKYDFSDYTSYVIIEEDGTFKKYDFDNNIDILPYLIICEEPDSFELKNDTLIYKTNTLSSSQLKPLKYLVDGSIDTFDKLNYYNDIPLGYEIDRNNNEKPFGDNYNGRSNITISKNATIKPKSNANLSETFYRHSGNYMPIFYDIELFKSSGEYDSLIGNYKFDESLTFFGLMKQRVISKINRKSNILKLRDDDGFKSVYPMVDEFGYTFLNFFIFKSSWDFNYHVECTQPNTTVITAKQKFPTLNRKF